MNQREARDVLDVLLTAFPNADMPEATLRVWLGMLTELRHDVAQVAAESIVRSDRFFPSIARFREATQGVSRDQRHQWTASPTCPICLGTTVVTATDGAWWLCRCAAYERKPTIHTGSTKPPPELLDAARRAIPNRSPRPGDPR